MKGKTKRRAPFVVAFVAALGVTLTASPALAKTAAWCPQQAHATCEKPKTRQAAGQGAKAGEAEDPAQAGEGCLRQHGLPVRILGDVLTIGRATREGAHWAPSSCHEAEHDVLQDGRRCHTR